MKMIEIVILPNGTSRVETRGFIGAACQQASRFLEQALGRSAGETFTAEYHQTESSHALGQRRTNAGSGDD